MELKVTKCKDKEITVSLSGRVDSSNARDFESDMSEILKEHPGKTVFLDLSSADLITSAGLRVLLRALKQQTDLRAVNVSDKLYDVFEMTGFTELMLIERPIRKIVLDEEAVEIGHGANSTVYKTAGDLVIKVLREGYDDTAIKKELEKTRRAFVMGIPTVIPFAIVEVEGKSGLAFELVEANSLAELLAEDENNLDKYIQTYVDTVKQFHNINVDGADKNIFTDSKTQICKYISELEGKTSPEILEKIKKIIDDFAVGNQAIHGDIQPCNLMITDDGPIYIDMDTLSYGNPEFDLVYLYNTLINFQYVNPMMDFMGISDELAQKLWDRFVRTYFNSDDDEFIKNKERIYRPIGLCRLYRWSLKHISDRPDCIAEIRNAFEDAVRNY